MRDHLDKQFNRVFLSAKDMEKSLAYFSAAEKLHASEEWDAVAGLIAAGIVAYARPFSNNKPHARAVPRPLFPKVLLNSEERSLHDRLLQLRNTVVAHSDAEMNPAKTVKYKIKGFLVSSRIYNPVSEAHDLQKIIALSKKSLGIFEDTMFDIARKVSEIE